MTTPSAQTVTAKWQWQHDAHLVDLTGRQTLLRDVTFWNITADQKRLIELAPTLAASLAAVEARGKRLEEALREILDIATDLRLVDRLREIEKTASAALSQTEEGR